MGYSNVLVVDLLILSFSIMQQQNYFPSYNSNATTIFSCDVDSFFLRNDVELILFVFDVA